MAARLSLSLLLTLASFAAVWGADASRTVIVGGYNDETGVTLRKADLISDGMITHLPDLPEAVFGNGVVVHHNKLYSCGGAGEDSIVIDKCFILDLGTAEDSSSSWSSNLELPETISHQPMIAVEENIWVLNDAKVIVVPFNGDSSSEYNLPQDLYVSAASCGGGHELVRFVIPDGEYDIWINTNPQNPGEWTKKASVGNEATYRSCMINGKDIYVTGGVIGDEHYSKYLTVVERFNVEDNTIRSIPDLLHIRAYHGMGLITGHVAVFGGYNGSGLGSVEVYNDKEEEWELYPLTLSGGKLSEMGYTTY